jgi:hypothetical protein
MHRPQLSGLCDLKYIPWYGFIFYDFKQAPEEENENKFW